MEKYNYNTKLIKKFAVSVLNAHKPARLLAEEPVRVMRKVVKEIKQELPHQLKPEQMRMCWHCSLLTPVKLSRLHGGLNVKLFGTKSSG